MKRWLKRLVVGVGVIMVLIGAVVMFAVQRANHKLNRNVSLPAYPIALSDDPAVIERGRYLYVTRGCAECHAENGAGRVVVDDPSMGMRVVGPNISPGPGNVVANYTAADWERIIRHGVKPDGRPAMVMPSEDYARLTDADVSAMVAYVQHMPPASGGAAVLELPLIVRAMYGLNQVQDAAEKINHDLPPAAPVPETASIEHGKYVGQGCQGCHGPGMSGGRIPGSPPDWPAATNLTPGEGSVMPRYATVAQFKALLRSGKRPDGSAVSTIMPFGGFAQMNDVDMEALYLYLQSLPPRAAGNN